MAESKEIITEAANALARYVEAFELMDTLSMTTKDFSVLRQGFEALSHQREQLRDSAKISDEQITALNKDLDALKQDKGRLVQELHKATQRSMGLAEQRKAAESKQANLALEVDRLSANIKQLNHDKQRQTEELQGLKDHAAKLADERKEALSQLGAVQSRFEDAERQIDALMEGVEGLRQVLAASPGSSRVTPLQPKVASKP